MASKQLPVNSSKKSFQVTGEEVKHIAHLANLSIKKEDEEKLKAQFIETLNTVNKISELDTSGVIPTSQVTGLTNVMREDVIDHSRILSQSNALSGAKKSYNGYFVVTRILYEA